MRSLRAVHAERRARTRLCAQAHSDRRTAAPHGRGRVRCDVSDDREGAVALTSHLVALGHRRIAMIAGPEALSTTRYRIAGYREVMRRAGLAARIERGPYTPDHGYAATRELLSGETKPTAIFSSASPLTSACYARSKISVPACRRRVARGVRRSGVVRRAEPAVDVLRSPAAARWRCSRWNSSRSVSPNRQKRNAHRPRCVLADG